ncbi:PhzF family phenazine biosynthesis protein [Proteobacteria bacterium 005FR1]|nr:PhzF family phenazine biosynthesis protein [Proteobacteria bacterium 005FR1]
MPSSPKTFIVDAFTHGALRGNPAAVVVLEQNVEAAWMQMIAAEFNLSETAFLVPNLEDSEKWSLRWFTPTTEVDLCGHATLASAYVIWTHLQSTAETLRFQTRSGELQARRADTPDGESGVALNFPRCSLEAMALDRLDLTNLESGLQASIVDARIAGEDLLLVVSDAQSLRRYRPDFDLFRPLSRRGLIMTAAHSSGDPSFVSRFFAPNVGVPEDPVTGSAHCALMPYWSEQLGKTELIAEQWSERGGRLHLALKGDRVQMIGQARTFLQGQLSGES